MNPSTTWTHPIILPELEPPRTEIISNNLYTLSPRGMELARCFSTETVVTVPERCGLTPVTAIAAGAFSNAANLCSVTLPCSILAVGDYAFYRCAQLTEVCIRSDLQHIGDRAFAGCTGLKSIYIPPTVRQIGAHAFRGCRNLVIQGAEGSAAQRYAEAHGLFFMTATGPCVP